MILNILDFTYVITSFFNAYVATFLNQLLLDTNELILVCIIVFFSFFVTLFLTRKWIKSAASAKLLGKDMNKSNRPLIPRSGGLVVAIVICLALLIYIFLKTFSILGAPSTNVVEVFALTSTVLLAAFIGFVDDVLGWKQGLSQLQKIVLTIPIALPLTVLNVDQTLMELPFLGNVNLGNFYPLLIVPLGIIGATNGFNLLAGYNGLETGMALVIFTTFGFTSFSVQRLWIAMISLIVITSLVAFLVFNWFPAKVFPGNSFTYAIGAMIAALAILGSMEKLAAWLFIPYYLEIGLYLRARFIEKMGDVQAFAKTNNDGSLELPYHNLYDMTHIGIWILKKVKTKVYEKDVVVFLISVQSIIAILGMILLKP